MLDNPKWGAVRVNSADYGGDVVVERFDRFGVNTAPCWGAPAWEEQGEPALAGPFGSEADAEAAIAQAEGAS